MHAHRNTPDTGINVVTEHRLLPLLRPAPAAVESQRQRRDCLTVEQVSAKSGDRDHALEIAFRRRKTRPQMAAGRPPHSTERPGALRQPGQKLA
jgi:hypothetical protein